MSFQSLEGCYTTLLSPLNSIWPRIMMLAFGLCCTPFLVLIKYKFLFIKKKKSLLQVAHKIQLNDFMSILKHMTAKKGVKKTIGKYSRWKF